MRELRRIMGELRRGGPGQPRFRARPARDDRQPVVTTSTRKQQSAARRAANRAKGEKRSHPRVRARPIHAGRTYKITRRCIERRMFFAPDVKAEEIVNFVGYCLAHAAMVYGIEVHACVFMSNHHHTDVTDPGGKLIEFKQLFHSMLARGINTLRGRFDAVWSRDKACDTRRAEDDETLGDLAYTLANPVTAGLVKWGDQWTGFTTYGWRFGETRSFTRPSWFFDGSGQMPETAELTLSRPPIYRELDDEQMFERLIDAVRVAERKAQQRLRRENRRFMGVEKLAKQHWNRAPRSFEERFTQAPSVAASSKWLVLAELQRDREWERAYAMAREELLAGREARFPMGTYWLRRFAGVTVGDVASV